jgi:uncharacterized membrane protein
MTHKRTEPGRASLSDHIDHNVSSVASLYEREMEALSPARRRLERFSVLVARPAYLVGILCFIVAWVAANILARLSGLQAWDPPPFQWLQGLLGLIALLTTTVVLIAQIRQSKLERQRAHLDLQVNLLTEQKVTALIRLVEELRRDLPMVKDRSDPTSEALQEAADATQVFDALKGVGLAQDNDKS